MGSGKISLLVPSSFPAQEKYELDPLIQRTWKWSHTLWDFVISLPPSQLLSFLWEYLSYNKFNVTFPPLPYLSQEMDRFQNQLHLTSQLILVVKTTWHYLSKQYWTRWVLFMVLKRSKEVIEIFATASTVRLHTINKDIWKRNKSSCKGEKKSNLPPAFLVI